MRNLLVTTALALCLFSNALGQFRDKEVQKVRGKAEIVQEPYLNQKENEVLVLKLAKLNAIEKAFGTHLSKDIYLKLNKENEAWFEFATSTLGGDYIVDIDEPKIERSTDPESESWIYRCEVYGKVRKRNFPKHDLEMKTLRCPSIRSCSDNPVFYDGDDFYFYFKSAVDGYLTLYLVDEKTAARILPYQEVPKEMITGIPIQLDTVYYFFDPAQDLVTGEANKYVDEFQMVKEKPNEEYTLFVIFSTEKLQNKPMLNDGNKDRQNNKLAKKGFTWPAYAPTGKFLKWLSDYRQRTDHIQLEMKRIIID